MQGLTTPVPLIGNLMFVTVAAQAGITSAKAKRIAASGGKAMKSHRRLDGAVLCWFFMLFLLCKEQVKQTLRKGLPYKYMLQEIVRPDQPESGLPSGEEKRGLRWRNVAFPRGGHLSKHGYDDQGDT